MKYAAQFLVACLVILPASARSGGGHAGGGARGGGGFHAAVGGGFHGMSGGFRGGYGGYGYGGYGYGNRFFGNHRYVIGRYSPGYYGYRYGYPYWGFWDWGLGWDYPYYDTGYYTPSYDYGYQPPVVIYPTAPPPPAPVQSVIREYPDTSAPTATIRPAGEPPIYLIAIKGQDNILAGITYWVEGDTLQYINLQHVQKHVPISSIDRVLTTRLNRERDTDLVLPPA